MAKNTGHRRRNKAAAGGRDTHRDAEIGQRLQLGEGRATGVVHSARIEAVMASAQRSGLLHEKTGRIGGRVSPTLIERAKMVTGITADTELLEFALANVALEDNFADSFREVRGTVDPELKLGF